MALFAASDRPWLFGRNLDLLAFGCSALLSLALLAAGAAAGMAEADAPPWIFFACVIAVDVAHVWSTAFRVYLDGAELRRRPLLYVGVPLACYVVGVAAYSISPGAFWRVLAYVAVFHFVRQQYGWVMLYRARAGERDRAGRWLDTATIYLAMLYPLVWWHAHLPRRFWWFLKGDFASVPAIVEQVVAPVYWPTLAAYIGRSLYRWLALGQVNPGKDIVVATTALCWHVGIITFNSDYAFTVSNVLIHGIPYLVLIYWYRWVSRPAGP